MNCKCKKLSSYLSSKIIEPDWVNLTALVIDDVAVNRDILVKVLSTLGISSIEASNGVEALEELKRVPFDLFFIDIQMPVMDGFTLIKEIKALDVTLLEKTIAISANVYHDTEEFLSHGFSQCVSKPFKISVIKEIVSSVISNTQK